MSTEIARIKGLAELKKLSPAVLAKEIMDLRGSIGKLGDGEVFLRRNEKGVIKAVKASVTLREDIGEIQTIQKKTMVTAAGANKLNQAPGLSIVTPPSVIVDGKQESNPYIEKNHRRVIQSVYVRKVVFGPNPIGNMVAIDFTLYFNILTYFMQDLQAKVKKYPACGFIGKNIDNKPSEKYFVKGKKWVDGKGFVEDKTKDKEYSTANWDFNFYELESAGLHPVGIWVDESHPEIQSCLDSHVQRQKFGDRHAQSICTRNALLKHPAIASQNVVATGAKGSQTARATVYGFMHDMDAKTVDKMAEDISSGKVSPGAVEIENEFMEADYSDVVTAGEAGDEHGSNTDTTKTQEETLEDLGQAPDPERDAILETISEWQENVGNKNFVDILTKISKGKTKTSYPDDYTQAELVTLLQKLSKEKK